MASGTAAKDKKHEFMNVDFLRAMFAVMIVWFHSFGNLGRYIDLGNTLKVMGTNCSDANIIVEFFFIMSGFFLLRGIAAQHLGFAGDTPPNRCHNDGFNDYETNNDIVKFVCNKISRLFPVLFFSILITMLFGLLGWAKVNYITQFVNMFFLQTIGVTIAYKGINWYVSAYFWGIILYYCIFRIFKHKHAYLITAILAYLGCVLNINATHGGFGRDTIMGLFGLGLWRALFGIGVGIFVFALYNRVKDIEPMKLSYWRDKLRSYLISSVEILCFVFIIYNMLFHHIAYKEKLIFVLIFSIMFFLFLLRRGVLSKILNNKYLAYSGRWAYSIYVMQQVSFTMTGQVVKNIHCTDGIALILFITMPIIIGISTYYLVEIPFGKKLKNYLNYYLCKN